MLLFASLFCALSRALHSPPLRQFSISFTHSFTNAAGALPIPTTKKNANFPCTDTESFAFNTPTQGHGKIGGARRESDGLWFSRAPRCTRDALHTISWDCKSLLLLSLCWLALSLGSFLRPSLGCRSLSRALSRLCCFGKVEEGRSTELSFLISFRHSETRTDRVNTRFVLYRCSKRFLYSIALYFPP